MFKLSTKFRQQKKVDSKHKTAYGFCTVLADVALSSRRIVVLSLLCPCAIACWLFCFFGVDLGIGKKANVPTNDLAIIFEFVVYVLQNCLKSKFFP